MADENIKIEQQTGDDEISLMDLISVIAKRWMFIFFSTFIAAVLILGYSVYTIKAAPDAPLNKLPNIYRPQVIVRLQESSSSSTLSNMLNSSDLGLLSGLVSTSAGATNADLAQALIVGNTLADQIAEEMNFIEKYHIEKFPVTSARMAFTENLTVEYAAETGFLTIGFEDIDPVFATEVVNRSLELLEERFRSLTMDSILTRKEFLEQQLADQEAELNRAQEAIIEFQKAYGIVDIESQTEAQISELTSLNSSLLQKQVELIALKEKRREEDPQVQRLENDIDNLKQLIDAKTTGFQDFSTSTDYIPQNKLPELTAVYTNLQAEATLMSQMYLTFKGQYESVKLEEADNSKQFQIIERAEVPERKAKPSRSKICLIVTIAVMFLAIFLSFIFEYFDRIKKDPVESVKLNEIRNSLRLKK
ncbi:MAG: hypothetical protein PQJ61_15695 [Spirochaetales bacterium]|uniref:Polysaccharide chain length determinant N-terminal domain-containing protein n=1 Tax=Candidatus Thalassospirochaeta sargassi TaxID=3119039 RepID=A0AAJ1IF92_9SPIO|nr:hypothetical protein [Spirochaetales bacterium]